MCQKKECKSKLSKALLTNFLIEKYRINTTNSWPLSITTTQSLTAFKSIRVLSHYLVTGRGRSGTNFASPQPAIQLAGNMYIQVLMLNILKPLCFMSHCVGKVWLEGGGGTSAAIKSRFYFAINSYS
jgi:hypothetical protein